MKNSIRNLISVSVPLCSVLLLLSGCASTNVGTQSFTEHNNLSDITYKESVLVQTEPPGCKIYCQDNYVGISPVQTTIQIPNMTAVQVGSYTASGTRDDDLVDSLIGASKTYGQTSWQRTSATSWGPVMPPHGEWSWIFKAYKDGYETASQTLSLSGRDSRFRDAFRSADNGATISPSDARSILLTLSQLAPAAPAQQQQQQQQQQTVVVPSSPSSSTLVGTVLVTCDAQDAEVYVDGAFVGNVPANLKLSDGIHILEVKKTGLSTFKREVRVLANSETSIRATLQ